MSQNNSDIEKLLRTCLYQDPSAILLENFSKSKMVKGSKGSRKERPICINSIPPRLFCIHSHSFCSLRQSSTSQLQIRTHGNSRTKSPFGMGGWIHHAHYKLQTAIQRRLLSSPQCHWRRLLVLDRDPSQSAKQRRSFLLGQADPWQIDASHSIFGSSVE